MLDELTVHNLGVIEDAHLEPGPGLVVITGETGTGKTLLLGALRMLVGGDARPDLVGPFSEQSRVSCRFVDAGGDIGLARRVPRQGRSRAYIDGDAVAAAALTRAADGRVEIVGQHDQVAITRAGEARALVDGALDEAGRASLGDYRAAWDRLQQVRRALEEIGGDRRGLEREIDLLAHQVAEIGRSGFSRGDDRRLEELAARIRNAESLRMLLDESRSRLDRVRDDLGAVVAALTRAAQLDPGLADAGELSSGIESQLEELAMRATRAVDDLDLDPSEVEETERRVSLLADLKRKYGADLDEVLAYAREAAERHARLEKLLARADGLESELAAATTELDSAASSLRQARREAGRRLSRAAVEHLGELGLADPVLAVEVVAREPAAHGGDDVSIRFASDSRLAAGDIARVASGGELSRVVLALRLAAGSRDVDTLAFDEVDAGVGGATALAMGRKLAALAVDRQVLCVTHLPQVAAFARRHFVVDREGVSARVSEVTGEARVAELARMLAGLPESERGRQAATELLEIAAGEAPGA